MCAGTLHAHGKLVKVHSVNYSVRCLSRPSAAPPTLALTAPTDLGVALEPCDAPLRHHCTCPYLSFTSRLAPHISPLTIASMPMLPGGWTLRSASPVSTSCTSGCAIRRRRCLGRHSTYSSSRAMHMQPRVSFLPPRCRSRDLPTRTGRTVSSSRPRTCLATGAPREGPRSAHATCTCACASWHVACAKGGTEDRSGDTTLH